MARLTLSSIRPHRYVFAVCLVAITAFFSFSPHALAYHHMYLKNGATYMPIKWQTLPVKFTVDNGATDIFPEVQTAVTTWNNVTTAKDVLAAPVRATVDFTGANFDTAWGKLTGDGQQEVVFDADGSAFSTATGFAPGSANGVTRNVRQIVGGQAVIVDTLIIINGTKTNFDRLSTVVHELGHAQGLDHSSVGMNNSNNFPSDALNPISINAVPTMHPFSNGLDQNRRTLEPDDIASLSELYPEPSFATSLGSIEGTVKRCSTGNAAVTGANVRAVNVSNPNIQLSRFTGFDGNDAGRFVINGLPPGDYKLIIEPMGANGFTIGSAKDDKFRPPPLTTDIDFPTEYYNPPDEDSCTEELPDTAVNITVGAGGHATDKNFKVASVELAFVVDDTGSMSPEIAGVRQVLTLFVNILDNLHRTIGTPFPDTAIITFKDNVTKRVISDDPTRLRAVIDSLTATGGGDCPESSNAAVLAAGRQLRKGGVAMLITDADSRSDGPDRNAVTKLYRSKSLTLSTLLSGSCSSSGTSLKPSAEINGQALPDSTNFDEFPAEPTLGVESSVRTFSEESTETGGVFTFIPGIKSGDPTETQKYINTGTNIAVSSVVPAIALVSPGDGQRGTTLNIEINGANTNFQSSSVLTLSGDGITVNTRTINSPEKITANISIAPGATLGFRDVTVTTDLGGGNIESAKGFGAFNVIAPLPGPTVTSVNPSHGSQGATLNVTITGSNTHFVNGTSIANFGSGITVNTTTALSSTTLVANITINAAAVTSPRHVSVTTGSETANDSGVGLFMVVAPPPEIPRLIMLNPVQGTQGQTLDVAITGENTHFVNGTSVASFSGSGITVNSTTVNSPTSATVNLTIAPNALLGFRDAFVTTGAESAATLSAFQILEGAKVQLSASSYSVGEGDQKINITVTRSGVTSGPASVKYATSDPTDANFRCDPSTPGQATIYASRKCDYHIAVGTLRFAAGETIKQFTISLVDDVYVEAATESFTLTLSNPVGFALGQNSTASVAITDNDAPGTVNPIDNTRFFVRQLYVDLLSREPDPTGWDGWITRIDQCGKPGQPPPPCDRVTVAGDGFLRSGEFFDRQFFVLRLYRTGLGRILHYDEIADLAYVSGFLTAEQLELNKQDLVNEIVVRPEFAGKYNGLDNTQFVDLLLQTAGVTVPTDVRLAWITSLATKTRAQVFREISERQEVSAKYLHEAQVASAYYGFFTRNPDGAYLNYLQRLDSGEINLADLAHAFVNAVEYRSRFGQ